MQVFSITVDQAVLCDTPRCWSEIRRFAAGERLTGRGASPAEVVLCVVEGEMVVTDQGGQTQIGSMQGVQIPAGWTWSAETGAQGAKVLRVDSLHPHLNVAQHLNTPARLLMPPLDHIHRFSIANGETLVYTDYLRSRVLNFAPGFAADKHFHQDADEIFWFFQGTCRVTTPDVAILAPADTIVLTPAGEWHIIENVGDEPLLMFLTVTPNIVPSHTFFDVEGRPFVRSWQPLC
jgi:mannose-6-phosphate isomerase-like protein (cupin superfamily)